MNILINKNKSLNIKFNIDSNITQNEGIIINDLDINDDVNRLNTRVVNDTQSQSFETVSNAKIKVSKQYQKLKSKFRNTAKATGETILVWFGTMGSVIINKN